MLTFGLRYNSPRFLRRVALCDVQPYVFFLWCLK